MILVRCILVDAVEIHHCYKFISSPIKPHTVHTGAKMYTTNLLCLPYITGGKVACL